MWQASVARANLFIFINKFSLDGWNPFSSNGVGSLGGNLRVDQAQSPCPSRIFTLSKGVCFSATQRQDSPNNVYVNWMKPSSKAVES